MGSKVKMTQYERNHEMLAVLKVRSQLNDLSAASAKRSSGESVKKPNTETPVVRARGVPPDATTADGLKDDV